MNERATTCIAHKPSSVPSSSICSHAWLLPRQRARLVDRIHSSVIKSLGSSRYRKNDKVFIYRNTRSAQRSLSTLALASACLIRLCLQDSIKRNGQIIDHVVHRPLLPCLPIHTQPPRTFLNGHVQTGTIYPSILRTCGRAASANSVSRIC